MTTLFIKKLKERKATFMLVGMWSLYLFMFVMAVLTKRRIWTGRTILTAFGLFGLGALLILVTLVITPLIILEWYEE